MAMATGTALALALAAASAGLQYQNTKKTTERQDAQAAAGIRQQGERQKQADAKVADEVERLKASTAEDERAASLGSFMDALRKTKGSATAGLEGPGGEAFRLAAEEASTGVQNKAAADASLLARIDAAGQQRQGEGFGYGRLGTDLSLIGRQAAGDDFLNQLRLSSIRRNAGLDLAAGLMSAGSGAAMGGGGAAGNTLGASRGALTKQNAGFKNYGGP